MNKFSSLFRYGRQVHRGKIVLLNSIKLNLAPPLCFTTSTKVSDDVKLAELITNYGDTAFTIEDEFSDDELSRDPEILDRQPKIDKDGRAHGVGRRKTAVAQVWIKPGSGIFLVNRSPLHERFPRDKLQDDILEPMYVTGSLCHFDIESFVWGGGFSGQAGALRLGLARALYNYQPSLKKTLRRCEMVTRDPRQVERKKPGQPKARKKKQWVKR